MKSISEEGMSLSSQLPSTVAIAENHQDLPRSSEETLSSRVSDELLKRVPEAEAQCNTPVTAEQQVSLRLKLGFLAAYFILNLALTLSNRALLGKARFPWLLTTLHTSSTSVGCFMLTGLTSLRLTNLTKRENLTLLAFSVLFTLNIAVSNVSLAMVSVPFHQILRSMCPIMTIWIYYAFYGRTYSKSTFLSMIPLILGVALATAGDYYCTLMGFTMTALGVVLSSVKTVVTNRLMTGSLDLAATEVLLRMSPLAAILCVVNAELTGEVAQFRAAYAEGQFSRFFGAALLANAATAFALNLVSFQTNKVAGALTMTVSGNVKQALTIGLGIVLFDVQVGLLNFVGTTITIVGAMWYSKVELDNKRARSRAGTHK